MLIKCFWLYHTYNIYIFIFINSYFHKLNSRQYCFSKTIILLITDSLDNNYMLLVIGFEPGNI